MRFFSVKCFSFVIFIMGSTNAFHIMTTTETTQTEIKKIGQDLEEIPEGKPSMDVLCLPYNSIEKLPEFIFTNNSYQRLRKILLYQNKIKEISTHAFRGLRNLRMVDLSDNNITYLDPYTFKMNVHLKKLVLVNNFISFERLQTFLTSQSLEVLMLSNNRIDQIYELTFLGVPNLKILMLSNNQLLYIAPNTFKTLNKLSYLSMANTSVYRLGESMFGNLPRIVNVENTPLANRFDPPLRKVRDQGLTNLIKIDRYIP